MSEVVRRDEVDSTYGECGIEYERGNSNASSRRGEMNVRM